MAWDVRPLAVFLSSSPPPTFAHSASGTLALLQFLQLLQQLPQCLCSMEHPSSEGLRGLFPHFLYDSAQWLIITEAFLINCVCCFLFLHSMYLPCHIHSFMVYGPSLGCKHPRSRDFAPPGPRAVPGTQEAPSKSLSDKCLILDCTIYYSFFTIIRLNITYN